MVNAMNNAGIDPSEIQFINAHGTSTPLGDANETNAIKAAFG
jgi:3-oxoacyl-[acyl-carrier-protein] synthase II